MCTRVSTCLTLPLIRHGVDASWSSLSWLVSIADALGILCKHSSHPEGFLRRQRRKKPLVKILRAQRNLSQSNAEPQQTEHSTDSSSSRLPNGFSAWVPQYQPLTAEYWDLEDKFHTACHCGLSDFFGWSSLPRLDVLCEFNTLICCKRFQSYSHNPP